MDLSHLVMVMVMVIIAITTSFSVFVAPGFSFWGVPGIIATVLRLGVSVLFAVCRGGFLVLPFSSCVCCVYRFLYLMCLLCCVHFLSYRFWLVKCVSCSGSCSRVFLKLGSARVVVCVLTLVCIIFC